MKNKVLKLSLSTIGLIAIICILNLKVTTKQGINYKVQTIKIPLYLKVLDFFDRHYNYKWTVYRIIGGVKTDKDKVLQIFKWTYKNIKKAPDSYSIVDDHVWHIMVRGYGVDDQFSDVFTTLCNYANIQAFYNKICKKDSNACIYLSFVKIDNKWFLFDPYNGVYFRNNQGGLADIEEIILGNWVEINISTIMQESVLSPRISDVGYSDYLKNVLPITGLGLNRANTQSPLNRLKFQIKKWFGRI